jgi:hypothetical protein
LSFDSAAAMPNSALVRHKADHLLDALRATKAGTEEKRAETLLDRIRALHDRSTSILDRAERDGDLRVALAAIRETRGVMELLVKITGPVPVEAVPTVVYGFDPDLVFPNPPKYVAEWGTADGKLAPLSTPADDHGAAEGGNSPGGRPGQPSA